MIEIHEVIKTMANIKNVNHQRNHGDELIPFVHIPQMYDQISPCNIEFIGHHIIHIRQIVRRILLHNEISAVENRVVNANRFNLVFSDWINRRKHKDSIECEKIFMLLNFVLEMNWIKENQLQKIVKAFVIVPIHRRSVTDIGYCPWNWFGANRFNLS